ncbi:MAG: Lrp/AsnC family transcriptional regulator [Ilumatobacteraceae bacterium]
MIDDTDRAIIEHLQRDGRMPYSQLGQLVGLSDAAARQRVNRLTGRGVIDIVAVTDPAMLGLDHQALLGVTITGDVREIAADLGALDEAVYVVMTAGRYDLVVEFVCPDGDTLVDVVNRVRTSPGVATVEMLTYLGITKQTYNWGVGAEAPA